MTILLQYYSTGSKLTILLQYYFP